ncbi:glutamine amidotransferase [Micrococcus sp. FDAARGOS_333]|nr:glutamine amidotransferase [Micrococcus sp. FDAARGOS_333]
MEVFPPAARPFLLIQTRPEDDASAAEATSVRRLGGYTDDTLTAFRLEEHVTVHPEQPVDWGALLAEHSGVILSGSPFTTSDPEESKSELQHRVETELARMLEVLRRDEIPFLGCCYGVGTLGRHAGGTVDTAYGEKPGPVTVTLTEAGAADPLLEGLPEQFFAYVGHKEGLTVPPEGAVVLATGERCPIQMFRLGRHQYATQFHPELDQDGLLERLRIYAHHGYMEPHEAEDVFARIRARQAPLPPRILENFRRIYG